MYKLYTMTFIRKIKKKSGIYLAEVESYREDGKVKQKVIKYLGKEVEGKPVKRISTTEIDKIVVKQHGQIRILKNLTEKLGYEKFVTKEILVLIYSHLIESKLSINKIEDWVDKTTILEELKIDRFSTKELYAQLSEFFQANFDIIEKSLIEQFNEYSRENEGIFIDITDTYFEGGKYLPGKKRKGKDGKYNKLIQIGLAITRKNGFPIHHKVYEGNVHSSKIFKDMMITLIERGYSSLTILDRGIHSKENIKLTKISDSKIIIGLKKDNKLVEYINRIDKEELYSEKYRIKLTKLSVFVKSFPYEEGRLLIVYNPSFEYVKRELMFEKNEDNENRIKYAGFSLIYTDTDYDDKEVVRLYFEKDLIEKAFKLFKGVISLRPIRVWLKEHIISHIHICYLAFGLLSLLNYKVKKLNLNGSNALEEMDGVFQIKILRKDGTILWEGLNEAKNVQKEIFNICSV